MNPTTPKAHRITPEDQPQFPCWLWHDAWKAWLRFKDVPTSVIGSGWEGSDYTHYHPDQPTAPTSIPTPVSSQDSEGTGANLKANLRKVREFMDTIKSQKAPLLGTIMLQPTGANHSFPITDETAAQLIADQYGPDHDFVKSYPQWDKATLSVRAGMLTFIEARIAAPRPNQPAQEAAERAKRYLDCAEYAWTIIANASGGNWELESKDWQAAAAKWRDESYYPLLDELRHFPAPSPGASGEVREALELAMSLAFAGMHGVADSEIERWADDSSLPWDMREDAIDCLKCRKVLAQIVQLKDALSKPAAPMLPGGEDTDWKTLFAHHTEAVGVFLNELYAIMVDPLADGKMEVSEMKAALIEAAKRSRDQSATPLPGGTLVDGKDGANIDRITDTLYDRVNDVIALRTELGRAAEEYRNLNAAYQQLAISFSTEHADAERYRYLRAHWDDWTGTTWRQGDIHAKLDAALDAARSDEK